MGKKIIISGGGTGGHIFPAISIANGLKREDPSIDILFVGAIGKMEMEKVPAAGYPIKGLPVAGLKRSLSLSNLALPFKVAKSLQMAKKIIKDFGPDVVVGVGGYASAPLLWSASQMGIPTLIQEQNSYAGLTNKILSKRAKTICTAYEGMEKFFPADRITLTGNPIRGEISPASDELKVEGIKYFGLNPELPTLLVLGGSLGCRTLNNALKGWINEEKVGDKFQIIWQSGKGYSAGLDQFFTQKDESGTPTHISNGTRICGNIHNCDFISRMDLAYAASDLVVSRAGAGTISELCAAGKGTIFVPSPVVAEDHQTHNAMALVHKGAAVMVKDSQVQEYIDCKSEDKLYSEVERLLFDKECLSNLEHNAYSLAKPNASKDIALEVLKLIK